MKSRILLISIAIILTGQSGMFALDYLGDDDFYRTTEGKTYVVDFYADWCAPCRAFAPTFEKVAERLSDYHFAKVDVDDAPGISGDFSIQFIPYIAAVRDGEVVAEFTGNRTEEVFYSWCAEIFGADTDSSGSGMSENSNLPEYITVYTNGNTVVNQYYEGFEEKRLPIANHYTGNDGVYIAVYTHNRRKSVYSVGGGIHVIGMIRVKGEYTGRIAQPEGYRNKDISAADYFKEMAGRYYPAVRGDAWVGGDTGGFFGRR